ncbi:MAG: transporter substrate-binding domain-containing protein [Rhodobacteraceae bacterium]|nr:transporter substrate-binding domain-containing protein [Paracoccaceae bacterium]
MRRTLLRKILVPASFGLFALTFAPTLATSDTVERLRSGSTELRLGYRTDAAPFSSEADGARLGFTIDLCNAIADRIEAEVEPSKVDIVWRSVSVSTRFTELQEARIDMLCGATTVTDARREIMSFTVLTYQTDGAILINADAFANDSWGDAIGALVSTTSRDVMEQLLTEAGDGFAELRVFENRGAGVASVREGEIDSFFGDRAILEAIAEAEPGRFVVAETSFSIEPYAIALRVGDDAMLEIANDALRDLYRTGEINEIHKKWFGGQAPPDALLEIYRSQISSGAEE